MDKLKPLLLLVLLLANKPSTLAQKNSSIQLNPNFSMAATAENIFIHANTTLFVSGETLHCKLYCINSIRKTASSISKIAYIELIDQNKKSVFKSKIYLENGTGKGDFFIPTTYKSGNYKLISYTNWMLNSSLSNFFEMDITIINPFQPYSEEKTTAEIQTVNANNSLKTIDTLRINSISTTLFSLETDKETYRNREKINLTIKSLTPNLVKGSYSVSVRKIDNLPSKKQLDATAFIESYSQNKIPSLSHDTLSFLPELRGELISGKISSKTGSKEVRNKTVALSIPGKYFAFKIVQTNQNGKFTFLLDKSPMSSSCVIQIMEEDRNDFNIELDNPNTVDLSSLIISPKLDLKAIYKKAIEQRSIASQIENAYYKKDSLETELKPNSFFHNLEKDYILDDYTRFTTLKETLTEIILEMYYRKNNGKYSIHLKENLANSDFFGIPLILVDGLLIQDVDELFDYDARNIYKMSIVNQSYVYGPKIFGGILNIVTKNMDFQTKTTGDFIKPMNIDRPLSSKNYYNPEYSDNNLDRIPDYRFQLLWNPEITLERELNYISFYTSDVSGQFEVVLDGMSNQGIPVTITKQFSVK